MSAKALGAAVCTLLGLATGGVRAADKAAPGPLQEPGQVEAAAQANLYSAIPAYAESVSVDIGDHVKKGDVLAVLAAPDLKAELKQKAALLDVAKAQVEQSKRAVEAASAALEAVKAHLEEAEAAVKRSQAQSDFRKGQLKRLEQLFNNPGGPVIDSRLVDEQQGQADAAAAAVEEAQAALKAVRAEVVGASVKVAAAQADVLAAEARVAAAEADVQHAQVMVDFTQLKAPFDGVVVRRSVTPGDYVRPPSGDKPTPLFVVARVDSVRVVVAVPERDAVRLKPGAPAVVHLDALKGQEFKGKVTRTAGALDPESRTLRVEIDLPNPDGKLMPGMYGTVIITPEEGAPPKSAPDKQNQGAFWIDPRTGNQYFVGVQFLPFKRRIVGVIGRLQAAEPTADKDEAGLKKALVEAAKSIYEQDLARMKGLEANSPEDLYVWSRRWLDAEVDLAGNKEERVAAHQRHLDRMKNLEKMLKNLAITGQGRQSDATAGAYYRTQAELWLTQAQGQ